MHDILIKEKYGHLSLSESKLQIDIWSFSGMAKIVIVLNASWNVWNFRLPLLLALQKDGHDIEVIAPYDQYTDRIPFSCHSVFIHSKSINPVADIKTLWGLTRLYKKIHPDIALLYTVKPNVYGNFAATLSGVKTISNVAGLGTVFIRKSFIMWLVKKLYRLALRVPKKVFFQNQDDLEQFISEGLVKASISERVPGSGVDLQRFSPRGGCSPQRGEPFIFLLPARMLWDKGIKEFVEAGQELLSEGYSVQLKLLGFMDVDNPNAVSRADMDQLTMVTGASYIGISDNIETEIADAHCVVLPSSYREGTPRSLLEAAAMGKPIITTDAVGCRDVVDDGVNGYLCKPKDTVDLYKKMKKMLLLSDEQRRDMGKRGRGKMEQSYDQEIVIDAYRRAIAGILDN
jgi:glycosyltransferase involved in cell wall biosynthesis